MSDRHIVCETHQTWATFVGASCYVCAQEARRITYEQQKSGEYYERKFGYSVRKVSRETVPSVSDADIKDSVVSTSTQSNS